jgi:hypothetical protein
MMRPSTLRLLSTPRTLATLALVAVCGLHLGACETPASMSPDGAAPDVAADTAPDASPDGSQDATLDATVDAAPDRPADGAATDAVPADVAAPDAAPDTAPMDAAPLDASADVAPVDRAGDASPDAAGDAVVCGAGHSACGSACVNLQFDRSHCGACGMTCCPGALCVAGRCAPDCPPGLTPCTPPGMSCHTCANLVSDSRHCGACNRACGAGQACVAGVCR